MFATGCGSCEDFVVSKQRMGAMEVILHRRVCGGVAGYLVSIAPPGEWLDGRADSFEPFFIVCDCYESEIPPPVTVRVVSPNHLEIRYDAARDFRIEKQRPRQGAISIDYLPEGRSPIPRE